MDRRLQRRESEGRRDITARGISASNARHFGSGSWKERACGLPTNRDQRRSPMRQLHSDRQLGRPAYRRPTRQNRVGWEGSVP
jgi:hypothetical protein